MGGGGGVGVGGRRRGGEEKKGGMFQTSKYYTHAYVCVISWSLGVCFSRKLLRSDDVHVILQFCTKIKLCMQLTKEGEKELSKGEVPVSRATQRSCHHLLVGELVGKNSISDEQYDSVVGDDGHQD